MIKSPRIELLRLETIPTSFLVVDGKQVIYETVSYANPEEFTIAIADYDHNYLAERYIKPVDLSGFRLIPQTNAIASGVLDNLWLYCGATFSAMSIVTLVVRKNYPPLNENEFSISCTVGR